MNNADLSPNNLEVTVKLVCFLVDIGLKQNNFNHLHNVGLIKGPLVSAWGDVDSDGDGIR